MSRFVGKPPSALLEELLTELEDGASLPEPAQLRQRIEALDRLEVLELALPDLDVRLLARAKAVQANLDAFNYELFESIRQDIRNGQGRDSFIRWLPATAQGDSYDFLDELVVGVLQLDEPGTMSIEPTSEMVFYQPTPARHIFDLLKRTQLGQNDVLIDLGSGLGHVPILTAICTTARSVGVELEPAYVRCARRSADRLGLKNVTFVQADARTADLSAGTLFYLYTPFSGSMLRQVLDSLRTIAAKREIRVCTLGPCTPVVSAQTWLQSSDTLATDQICIFRSRC